MPQARSGHAAAQPRNGGHRLTKSKTPTTAPDAPVAVGHNDSTDTTKNRNLCIPTPSHGAVRRLAHVIEGTALYPKSCTRRHVESRRPECRHCGTNLPFAELMR